MAKGRELKGRIRSVENTRKITRTMEMVAASKMKRAQDRVAAARPYAQALADVLASLYSPERAEGFPLLRQPQTIKRATVLLLTSNRGLAGAFNANLIKEARATLARLESAGTTVDLHVVGRKGTVYFRYVGRALASNRLDIGDRPTAEHAAELIAQPMEAFARGDVDAVFVVHSQFKSVLSAPPTTTQVLPVVPPSTTRRQDYILSPDPASILGGLLPAYVRNAVYRALVETAAAEQAARRTAMKNATDNAGDMLNTLRRNYNRARQANITQEIAEIVGGAAALQG